MYDKHPELRDEIKEVYDKYLQKQTIRLNFSDQLDPVPKINAIIYKDGGGILNKDMAGVDLKILKSESDGSTKVLINGVSGTLKEM